MPTTVTFQGVDWTPGELVTVSWDSPSQTLFTIIPNEDGIWSQTANIPLGSSIGNHTITASSVSTTRTRSFTVNAVVYPIYAIGSSNASIYQFTGGAWVLRQATSPTAPADHIRISSVNPDIAFASAFGNLSNTQFYRTIDGGATWSAITLDASVQNVSIHDIYPDPVDANITWATAMVDTNPAPQQTWASRIYRSTDQGNTWAVSNSNPELSAAQILRPKEIAISNNGQTILYIENSEAAAPNKVARIHRSTNGGDTWSLVDTFSLTGNAPDVLIALNGSRALAFIIETGVAPETLRESTNSGSTWSTLQTGIFVGTMIPNGNGYFITNNINTCDISRTNTNGVGFADVANTLIVGDDVDCSFLYAPISASTQNNTILYALNDHNGGAVPARIYRSADNGSTWTSWNTSFNTSFPGVRLTAITIGPSS